MTDRLEEDIIKEKKSEKDKIYNNDKNIINNYTPKKRNKLSFIKQNTNSDYSNKQIILPNTYDNDESYDKKNFSNFKYNYINIKNDKNINLNKSSENNINNASNSNYITKNRRINFLKYVIKLQKFFRNLIKISNYYKKINNNGQIISKSRINNITYNKFINTINESKIIIKIPTKYKENNYKNKKKKFPIKNNILDRLNINNNINNVCYETNNEISYITKIRHFNNVIYIEKIQKNWRIVYKNKNVYKKLRQKKCIIDINRFKNNIKEIIKIQNIYRERIFKKNEEKNKILSRKNILFGSIYKGKSNIKRNNKNKNARKNSKDNNNKLNNNDIKRQKGKIKNSIIKGKKKWPNSVSNISLYNNNKSNNIIKRNNNINIDSNNSSNSIIEDSFQENNKKEFSNSNINYITKIYKIIIYKKNKNIKGYYISKESKKLASQQKNLAFISLLNLFILKNTQEYIFYLLKYNTKKSFIYPFYNRTLQRVIKYLHSNPKPSQGGEKIKKFFLKIFPDLYSFKSNNIIISFLNSESQKQLINTNLYNAIEPDFLNYICNFSKYDKHLSNSTFIEARLKNTKLINTNIFTITRFIDDEYNNLINGKYCYKCYSDLNKCICNKKLEDEYYYDDEDIDIDFDIDFYNKNKLEYNSTKCKGSIINRKPKAEEIYEDPITNLINKKDDYLESKGHINNSKSNKINISESQYGSNSSIGTNFNSKILDKIKNNIGSENNSLNNSKNIAQIKAIYHKKNKKKKENLILMENNESSD